LLAAWVVVLLAAGFRGDDETPWRWGLVPAHVTVAGLLGYAFLQAGWGQLIANALPLILLGPPLEERWGRVTFAGFVVLAGVAAGGAYALSAPGSQAPLLGANGVVSALMGACLVRFWSTPVRFFHALWSLRIVPHDAWAPVWVMLPIWFLTRLLLAAFSNAPDVVGGAAPWCDAGGFVFGAAVAFGMRWGDFEGRVVDRNGESRTAVAGRSLLDRVCEMKSAGQADAAFELLSNPVRRQQTDDPEVLQSFWELARDLGRTEHAASLVFAAVGSSLARGDESAAIRIWKDVGQRAPNALAPRRLILQLVPVLRAREEHALAVETLRRAFDPRHGELRTGQALQLLEAARELDPPAALVAARRALASTELPLEKRDRIEALATELAAQSASLPAFDPGAAAVADADTTANRAIALEIDPADDIVLPSEMEPEHKPVAAVRELDATGSLVASDSDGELVPASVSLDRWAGASDSLAAAAPHGAIAESAATSRFFGVKVIEVALEQLEEDGLSLRRMNGGLGPVAYTKIQALAVAAVAGLANKPVLVIDVLMNWNDVAAEQLQVLRMRSDRFDVKGLMPQATSSADAFRALLEQLLARTGAVPLPDRNSVRGRPFSTHADLADYERAVLQVAR